MPCLKPNRWLLPILLLAFTLSACTPQQGLDFAMLEPSMEAESNLLATVNVYHPDPSHLWNRVFAHFYVRIAQDGTAYGENALEPLLWPETTHLLEGAAHQQALALLDAFLTQDTEMWLDDPLKRALMQRDLWAVFDWLTLADTFPEARQALQVRLAAAIGQLALSRAEIEALPDNYQMAVDSGAFPAGFDPDSPHTAFLPSDLFAPNGAWVNLGREGGSMAISHLTQHPFLGRSTFLIFMHMPENSGSIKDYLQSLREAEQVEQMPPFPSQLQVILLRQMMLIDEQGEIVRTRLVESVQLRVGQMDAQFNLSRNHLFAGKSGGLRPLGVEEREFPIFQMHGFDRLFEEQTEHSENLPPVTLNQCAMCHRFGPHPISVNFSRFNFGMQSEERILVRETTPDRESRFTMAWKQSHASWARLKELLDASPHVAESVRAP